MTATFERPESVPVREAACVWVPVFKGFIGTPS
jgi:hypothetical protein